MRADAQKLTEDEAALTAFRVGMTELEQNVRSVRQRREHGAGVFNELQMEKMAVGQEIALLEQAMASQKNRWDGQQKQMASVKEQIESLSQQNEQTEKKLKKSSGKNRSNKSGSGS